MPASLLNDLPDVVNYTGINTYCGCDAPIGAVSYLKDPRSATVQVNDYLAVIPDDVPIEL